MEIKLEEIKQKPSFLATCLILFVCVGLIVVYTIQERADGVTEEVSGLYIAEKKVETENFVDDISVEIQDLDELIPESCVLEETVISEEGRSYQDVCESREEDSNEDIKQQPEIEPEPTQEQEAEQEEIKEQRPEYSEERPEQPRGNLDGYLNSYVLNVITRYEIGPGVFPYLLNNDYQNYNGVTTNLYYQGRLLLRAHPSGNRASHCTGITFEVFFKAMQERNKGLGLDPNDFNGMTWDELFDFVLLWYKAFGAGNSSCVVAVERYGIGRGITNLEDTKAGDFIQFSRNNRTGHIGVFIEWVRDRCGNIIGFTYWSSQGSTGGISYNTEYFIPHGRVLTNHVYIARVLPVSQYRSIR